jgi:Zn-finger nucleic acid-binding protein
MALCGIIYVKNFQNKKRRQEMRKFTTIFMAVVLCIAALTVFAFAAETDCDKGEHDWSAWTLVKVENGDKYFERSCACGTVEPQTKVVHAHKEEKIPGVAATCEKPGLTEGKKCTTCGEITVPQKEIAPLAHTFEKVEAKAATCFEMGNIAYEVCTACNTVVLENGMLSNILSVKLPITHNLEHVAAKAATCFEPGNIEYWYCKDCGYAWLDEFCILNSNLQAVKLQLACRAVSHFGQLPAELGCGLFQIVLDSVPICHI